MNDQEHLEFLLHRFKNYGTNLQDCDLIKILLAMHEEIKALQDSVDNIWEHIADIED